MTMVLSINTGSSTLKLAVHRVVEGKAQQVARTLAANLSDALDEIWTTHAAEIDIVAHRVVHGGPKLTQSTFIGEDVIATIEQAIPFAPLHLPAELANIRHAMEFIPNAKHVACFDTTFHQSMPDIARRLPLPSWAWDEGIRRYGFHGLSFQHIVDEIGADVLGNAVIAHLGSGSSTCAIADGKSVDTSMSFTPGGGLMMGTRSGDVDPGLVTYLIRERGYDVDTLFDLFEKQSGLLGVSGETSDMQELLALSMGGNARATFAIAQFAYIVAKQIGAHAVALGGIRSIVFTGGIGENARDVREQIMSRLQFLETRVLVVPADEESAMATSAAACLFSN